MVLLLFLILLNIVSIHSKFFGIFLAIVYFAINGKRLGKWLFPEESLIWQTLAGIFFILSFFSLFGAIIYYIYRLNDFLIALLIISLPILIKEITKKWPETKAGFNASKWIKIFSFAQTLTFFAYNRQKLKTLFSNTALVLKGLYLIFFFAFFYILSKSVTADAIRSPWLIIPKYFFILYILMTLCLIAIIWKSRSQAAIFFIILHAFLSSSLALFVYKYGYGFDPFIHQATEKVILEKGFILPKTLYYLGQYSLVITLAKIFQTGAAKIDKFLVPVFFSLYLPLFLYYSLKKAFHWEPKYILLSILALMVLPFREFIYTTPQSLANIYTIIIIFLALILYSSRDGLGTQKKTSGMLLFLAATAIFIHPLTGIPVFIFLCFLILLHRKFKFQKLILAFIFLLSGAIIPLTFLINSLTSSSLKINWKMNFINFQTILQPLFFHNERHYDLIRDFVYLYGFNIIPIFLLIVFAGALIVFYKKETPVPEKINTFKAYIFTALVLIINYIILVNYINFDLISYEQNNYSLRLLILAAYFLLPFFTAAVYYFLSKLGNYSLKNTDIINGTVCSSPINCPFSRLYHLIKNYFTTSSFNNAYPNFFFLLFFAFWLTASLYLTYPRYDDYNADRGYNVADADFKAAEFIETDGHTNFIVLANQSTAAAALTKFGFKQYYQTSGGPIFYYPIPTSSPLYQFYLEMANNIPSHETMTKAMAFAGVKEGYFVVNNYWWHAGEIIETAKMEANTWKEIDGGKIYVFKYILN